MVLSMAHLKESLWYLSETAMEALQTGHVKGWRDGGQKSMTSIGTGVHHGRWYWLAWRWDEDLEDPVTPF